MTTSLHNSIGSSSFVSRTGRSVASGRSTQSSSPHASPSSKKSSFSNATPSRQEIARAMEERQRQRWAKDPVLAMKKELSWVNRRQQVQQRIKNINAGIAANNNNNNNTSHDHDQNS